MAGKSQQKDIMIAVKSGDEQSGSFSTGFHLGSSQENPMQMKVSTSPSSLLSNEIESENQIKTPENPKVPIDKDSTPLDDDEDEESQEDSKESENWGKWTWLIIIEWLIFVGLLGCMIVTLTIDKLKTVRDLELWRCFALALVFFCGRLFTRWMINLLVIFMTNKFFFMIDKFFRKEMALYFIYGMKNSFTFVVWLLLVLLAWMAFFPVNSFPKDEVTKGFGCSLVGAFIWLLKAFLKNMVASRFHGKRFFCRIRRAILNQHIFEGLSRPKSNSRIFKFWGKITSAWTMNDFINVKNGSILIVEDTKQQGKSRIIVADTDRAAEAAVQIFGNCKLEKSKRMKCITAEITRNDLLSNFDNDKEIQQMLRKQFKNEVITESNFKSWLVKVYNQRNSLAQTFKDYETTIEELNMLLSWIVAILTTILWCLMMGFLSTPLLVFIASQLLLLSFTFAETAKSVFGGVIFVFFTHPFDKGDCCLINGEEMIIEEINLLTTVFQKNGNDKILYPNCILATLPIRNFYKSSVDIDDYVELVVDSSRPARQIKEIDHKIKGYLESKPEYWQATHNIVLKDIDYNAKRMKIVLYVTHCNINVQDFGDMMSKRRLELINELKEIFENMNVTYHQIQPQDVRLKLSTMVH